MGHGKSQVIYRMKRIPLVMFLILISLLLTYLTIWYLPNNNAQRIDNHAVISNLETRENISLINYLKNMSETLFKLKQLMVTPYQKFVKFPSASPVQPAPQTFQGPSSGKRILIAGHLEVGYLKHIFEVFNHYGHSTTTDKTAQWDILWHHDYPFVDTSINLTALNCQKVNHFPGSGYITNKVTLMEFTDSQTRPPYMPVAFSLPQQAFLFSNYVHMHPTDSWVIKGNDHRGIQILNASEVAEAIRNGSSSTNRFAQYYVPNPLLIDGRKFDIGVYVAITSVEPLLAYAFYGDVLFRFCPLPYLPFDPAARDKYVVADDYTPLWEMPSLRHYYADHGATFKSALHAHFTTTGHDIDNVWDQIDYIISDVLVRKRVQIIQAHTPGKDGRIPGNFFEMVRFDFIIDEALMVHLMEANMSPNLSSDHFPPNSRLYRRFLNDLINLVGLASIPYPSLRCGNDGEENRDFELSFRDLAVFPQLCSSFCGGIGVCGGHEGSEVKGVDSYSVCNVCAKCILEDRHKFATLEAAFLEHLRKGGFKRLLPPPPRVQHGLNFSESIYLPLRTPPSDYTIEGWKKVTLRAITNLFQHRNEARLSLDSIVQLWFEGKCLEDGDVWCY